MAGRTLVVWAVRVSAVFGVMHLGDATTLPAIATIAGSKSLGRHPAEVAPLVSSAPYPQCRHPLVLRPQAALERFSVR